MRALWAYLGCFGLAIGAWAPPLWAQEPIQLDGEQSGRGGRPQPAVAPVLVFRVGGTGDPQGLRQSVAIQLLGVAPAVLGPSLQASGSPQRVAEAAAQVRARGAVLGLWLERGGGASGGFALLYLVGPKEDRALLDILRVPMGDEAELNRSAALKVREAYDLLSERKPLLETSVAPVERPPERSPWGVDVELGVAAATLDGSSAGQWGLVVGAGPVLHAGAWAFHGALRLRWYVDATVQQGAAQVRLSELGPGLSLRALRRLGDFELGADGGVALRNLSVYAEGPMDTRGGSERWLASVPLGLELRYHPLPHLGIKLLVGMEVNLSRERFSVNDQVLLDTGWVRPRFELALTLGDR